MLRIDDAYIEGLRRDDESALEELRKLCVIYADMYARDEDDAEDLADRTLEKARKASPRFNPNKGRGNVSQNFRKWLRTIARNAHRDYRRRRAKVRNYAELAEGLGLDQDDRGGLEADYGTVEDLLSADAYVRSPTRQNPLWRLAVKEVLGVLMEYGDRRKRAALILKFLFGLTTKEIALALGEHFDAVNTLLYVNTLRLREALAARGIGHDYLDEEDWR